IAGYYAAHRKEALKRGLLPRSGVEESFSPTGGTEFRVTAKKESNFGTVVFLMMWFGAVAAMAHFGLPCVFPLIMGGIGALILFFLVDQWIGVTTIQVDHSGITARRTWFGN